MAMAMCRLCLLKTDELITVDDELSIRIQNCVSIEINSFDNLPKTVCTLCLLRIDEWYYFRDMCIKSNEKLKQEIEGESFCEASNDLHGQASENQAEVFVNEQHYDAARNSLGSLGHEESHQTPCPICGTVILKTYLKLHMKQHTDRSIDAANISNEVLHKEISDILQYADLSITSCKTVRLELEEKLHTNLETRRRDIDKIVMELIRIKDDSSTSKKPPATDGYSAVVTLSPELANLIGTGSMPRHQVVKKIWEMINEKNLYDPANKQYVICDEALMKVTGVRRFRRFGLMKYLKKHFIS